MLFNSYLFVFAFLPAVAAIFFFAGLKSRAWAFRWLILASIVFYAWWRPLNLLIIAPSILVNFFAAKALLRLNEQQRPKAASIALAAGIVFNILVLGYFKYANFLVDVTNDIWGTDFVLAQIILPLGISFITFQKIAFLIDVHSRRIDSLSFQEYSLFVLFFPQLIAGPIVHFRELGPQFRQLPCRPNTTDLTVGLTLFFMGLGKKVFLADGIAPTVSSIFEYSSSGAEVSLLTAWIAAVGFTLQIYFDFSGYTDMALGAARIFGIRLPPNFDSPLRSSSIIEFWSRWHMTLTRFLTAYVYNPLSVRLTRRYMARGGRLTRPMKLRAFLQLLAVPTLVTMFISGVWHGAGYLFIVWGVLHGVYLVINHAWREFGPKTARYPRLTRPLAFVLTFACIVASMVVFRAPTVLSATGVFEGMLGWNGLAVPEAIYSRLGPLAALLSSFGVSSGLEFDFPLMRSLAWLALMLAIAFLCPNSLQLLRENEPALGWKNDPKRWTPAAWARWQPSATWAVVVALIAVAGALRIGGESEFLYWQF